MQELKHHEIPKIKLDECKDIANLEYTQYSCGIVHFHNAIPIPQDLILPYIDEHAYVPSCGLEIVDLDDGSKIAKDFEGNEFSYDNLLALPMRLGGFDMRGPVEDDTPQEIFDFFNLCEKKLYQSLIRYIDLYPLIVNTIWYKDRGHVLKYLPGASLGMHNDNDTNYRVIDGQRYYTSRNIAMYQVVNALVYFNDDYVGGEFRFPYADLTIKPNTGDIVFFPANYVCSHGVAPVAEGLRYTYLTQFCQGGDQNHIVEAQDSIEWLPPVFLPFVYQDYERFVKSGFSHYDDTKEMQLGFHASTPMAQQRSVEGPAVGTRIPYT